MPGVDTYLTIAAHAAGLYKEKSSRFVGLAFPVKDESEIRAILQQVRKEHYQCNHHCYAYRLLPDASLFRFSDDREPAGTAGKPILGQIQQNNLTDILIVVARYFGGSLLGVPGLIQAYRAAAGDAIQHAEIILKTIFVNYNAFFEVAHFPEVSAFLRQHEATILSQEFGESVIITFGIPKSRSNEFIQAFAGSYPLSTYCSIKLQD